MQVLVRIQNSTMADGINYTSDLLRYVLDYAIQFIALCNSKFQLTIGVFSIAFAIPVVEKVGEFLNMLAMQYELRYK